jgi:DNA-binding MarR family transcriptional regulator
MLLQMLRDQAEEPVGLLLAAIRRRLRQVVQAKAQGHRLSTQQFWALAGIREAAPLSLRELSELLRIDQPAASRVVASLTRRRLVRMAEDPVDRRRLVLETTAEGAELANRIRPLARDLRAALVAGFSHAEIAALRGALHRILENLDRLEARGARRPARPATAREEHA